VTANGNPRRRRLRWLVFIIILIGGIGAWAELSVLSPERGWVQRVLFRFVKQYQIATAWAPCDTALENSHELNGLTFRYPVCYTPGFEFPIEHVHSFAVFDRREMSGFSVVVARASSPERFARGEELRAERRDPACRRTMRHGWQVWHCPPEEPEIVRRSVEMVREPWFVGLDAHCWPHLAGTRLSEFVDEAFDEIVADICSQSPDPSPPD
jgi:hypothetical protein